MAAAVVVITSLQQAGVQGKLFECEEVVKCGGEISCCISYAEYLRYKIEIDWGALKYHISTFWGGWEV